jgi:hypothetical protein
MEIEFIKAELTESQKQGIKMVEDTREKLFNRLFIPSCYLGKDDKNIIGAES